jgi:hypothetical protein
MLKLPTTAGLSLSGWIGQVDHTDSAGFSVTKRFARDATQSAARPARYVAYGDVFLLLYRTQQPRGAQDVGRL